MKPFLYYLMGLISVFTIEQEAKAQDWHVSVGTRMSFMGSKSIPVFQSTYGILSKFKPALGYEVGISRRFPVGRFFIEPEVKYCYNTVKQEVSLLNQQSTEALKRSTFVLSNNLIEMIVPLQENINVAEHPVYVMVGPYLQFRMNEMLTTELGHFTSPIEDPVRFNYGLVAGLETSVLKRLSIRLQGQFSKYVQVTGNVGMPGSTLSLAGRYAFSHKNR